MDNWTYEYDANGMRTKRYCDWCGYQYIYSGSQLTQMKFEGSTLNFTYDASGTPLTMSIDGTVYYYVTNLQGDVVGLLDATGAQVVTYTYDAWGVGLAVTGTKANSIGALNPLRYRGYVYDVDTELYYLQSRYYDPQVGRFINADGLYSTGQGFVGNNMFAYCGNNPVDRQDTSGTRYMKTDGAMTGGEVVRLRYESAYDAARAFATETCSASFYIFHEYGAVIYSKTVGNVTMYDYTVPFAAEPHEIHFDGVQIPYGTTSVATVHTHPIDNNPSGVYLGSGEIGDACAANADNLDAYVIGPNLQLAKISMSPKTTYHYSEKVSPIALTASKKKQLYHQFKSSWDTHLDTCDKDCRNITWPRH